MTTRVPARAAGRPLRAALLCALLAAACADPLGAPAAAPHAGPPRAARGAGAGQADGYLVFLRAGVTGRAATAAALAERAGAAHAQPLDFVPALVLRGDVDSAALAADPRVARVTPNALYHKLHYPTDAAFYRRGWQWNIRQIGADRAATAGAGRRVCVVDGGADERHQELRGKVVAARAFPGTTPYAPGDDADGHGSHVATTVSANGVGVGAVAPGAALMIANVFGPDAATSVARITDAIAWCAQHGADVINLSVGGARTRGTGAWAADSTTYGDAARAARALGAVVVAAAGNDGRALPGTAPNGAFLPAEADGVLAVGATAPPPGTTFPFATPAPAPLYDARPSYSNHNSGADALGRGVDVYAPGGADAGRAQLDVTAACAPSAGPACADGRRYWSVAGTSMAAPHVAGLAALVSSRTDGSRSPGRVEAIEACILATADPLPPGAPFFGRGRINALRATTDPCPGL